jgi:hypothetical protein
MKEKKLFINFFNTNICLKTNSKLYYSFLKIYFSPLTYDIEIDKCDIFIDIFWEHGQWDQRVSKEVSGDFVQVGANTYIFDKAVATVFKEKQKIFFSWQKKDNIILNKAIIRSRFGKSRFFYLFRVFKRKEYFYQLTLQAIYYPLFYYLRKKQNMIVLHASAVDYKKTGVIFCGLDGMGKTSCALSLLKDDNVFLLSDNMVFVGNNRVYSCYEQVRLHGNGLSLTGKKLNFKDSNSRKGFYHLPKDKLIEESPIKLVFFLESASSNNISPISLDEAVQRAVCMSRLAGELQKYTTFYSLYSLSSNDSGSLDDDIVRSAFADANYYRVQIDFSLGLEHNMEFIRKKIEELK